MLKLRIVSFLFLSLMSLNDAFRILVVFPVCAKSHSILGNGVVRNLLEAGHEVVYITCNPDNKRITNLTEIDISHIEKNMMKDNNHSDQFKLKNLVGQGNFADSLMFFYITHELHKAILTDDVIVNFLSEEQLFDAVVLEWFFSDMIAGIASVFQSPLIWFGTTEAHWQVLRVVDEIPSPAYNVDLFSTSNSNPPLGFFERASELWTVVKKYVGINCLIIPFEKAFYHKVFTSVAAKKNITIPSYDEAVYNGSMLLINSHPSLGTPFRLPQNAKYVAGYHIDTKEKVLPQDLQNIMDQAKHGVIYFSMGSNLKSMDMSDHMRLSLLKMFSELKQTVIWKFESEQENVPKNVHLMKWVPQPSVLAHPNLKMFITHGGQLSTTEAIHYSIPVVGIPVFGDQHVNMKSAANKGFGIIVPLAEDMAYELAVAIREVLANPSYKNKAAELSSTYHDRPLPPNKELVYWIEHVVRTSGAKHLRSPALHVPLYQKAYLDALAFVALIIYLFYRVFKKVVSKKKAIEPASDKKSN